MKTPNKLINESSLYLQQHANNPVNWFPWGDEALKKAKQEDKPILVSIGYSSCHWCHVMERESFESQEVADYLNAHFVAIKVDREERPDIDHIYMEALQTMTGQGGWPLNMFLTPEQKPFYGGTYFPPKPMYGRPTFLQILHKMQEVFTEQRSVLEQKANELTQAISNDFTANIQSQSIDFIDVNSISGKYKEVFEPKFGGFSVAPKFPQPMHLEVLLRLSSEFGFNDAKNMALKTLDEMAKGGIYDQIGGGFHRYSTDTEWLAPHFEKMLYDNAQLLSVYSNAYRLTSDSFYYSIAQGIYTCLVRDFRVDGGGFASAWDADSEGVEGAFYVWNANELKSHITEKKWPRFTELVDWNELGNWENQLIIRLKQKLSESDRLFLKPIWEKLWEIRAKKEHPVKDTKVVLAWNAMAIQGMFDWYLISGLSEVKDLVVQEVDLLLAKRETAKRWERVKGIAAFSDDLSQLGLALIRAFQLTGNERYLNQAKEITDELREEFYDINLSTFSLASTNHTLIHNPKDIFDSVVPSANASCVQFLFELGHLLSDPNLSLMAQQVSEKLTTVIQKYPTSCSKHVQNALMIKSGFQELVTVGDELGQFREVLSTCYKADLIYVELSDELDSFLELIKGKKRITEKPTAYLCKNFSCGAPIVEKSELKKQLCE